ncbi:MAG: SDR family oxidoreductase [Chloroflexi bacterium]|nr:SDR family oxidoreductase [Chloroflexota bacterium]
MVVTGLAAAMPRYLVIGADGLVGRHIQSALAHGSSVATYRRDPERDGLLLDITDHAATRRIIRDAQPEVIVLAAADAYVERCERDPEGTRRVNVDAARVIAEAASNTGSLLVVFSSEYVFDGTAGAYSEKDERGPINEYGRQKVQLENLAHATGRGLVCRTSGVFGSDPRGRNFVLQLRDALRSGQPFEVPSDQQITPTYAPWLAAAVVSLAAGGHVGTFHVAGPQIMPRVTFARLIAGAYGLPDHLVVPRSSRELGLIATRPRKAGLLVDRINAILALEPIMPEIALRLMAGDEVGTGTTQDRP